MRVAVEDRSVAGLPLGMAEGERAGTDDFGNGLVRVLLCQACRHHDRNGVSRLAERLDDKPERLCQLQDENLVIDDLDVLHGLHQLLAERFALGPALDRGDATTSLL